jgi:hypothetical protein
MYAQHGTYVNLDLYNRKDRSRLFQFVLECKWPPDQTIVYERAVHYLHANKQAGKKFYEYLPVPE